jgi:hypothetical protein
MARIVWACWDGGGNLMLPPTPMLCPSPIMMH